MNTTKHFDALIPESMAGRRLDQVLAELFPQYSRTRLKQWLQEQHILVDGKQLRPRDKVAGGETVELIAVTEPAERWEAQDIPLDVVYEDSAILVINKPAGLVAHPAAGNRDGTLLNALLFRAPELDRVPRAGIIPKKRAVLYVM